MILRFGLLPSTLSKVAHRRPAQEHTRILAARATGPSPGHELEGCPILQQRNSGTCHAHSSAAARWVAQKAANRPLLWVPSPLLIASLTYADTQRVGPAPGPGWPPLQDAGAELQDGANAIRTWGIGPIGQSPDGEPGDVPNDPSDNTFPEPDLTALEASGETPGDAEYSIQMGADVVDMAAAVIDAGMPIRTGFFADSAFMQLGPNDVASAPNTSDTQGGGHSTYLRAHRLVNGKRQFRLANSWGKSWCDNGECWVGESWLTVCWELFPVPAVGGA
jgi:hypothetical protein